jgi:hypothetical protein
MMIMMIDGCGFRNGVGTACLMGYEKYA